MSTESKPKTPATTTTVSPDTSSEKATTQLKEQFSNLFGFFTKVSTDVTSSSTTNTNPITQKGFTGFLEALNKKAKEFRPSNSEKADKSTDKEKTSKEKEDKSHREKNESEVKPTEKENHNKEKGDKSNREKTPQQPPKEVQAQLPPKAESKKPGSAKAKPAEPPVAKYNSLQDLFGSLSNFVSHAATSIQTGSSNVYKKLEDGIDINARVKRGFRPTLIKQELREDKKIAVDNATKKRLEEAKKMKENFEKQLKNLDQEIVQLERGEEPNAEDGSNRSNQGKQPKKFRISSQKSFREGSDKSVGSGNEAKPLKKVLAPLEDGKHGGKKWHEGQKGIKNASSQPLYLRMEKEFQQNVVFPELEARKEKLKLKREFYKPMDDKELREHALKYEERKKTLAHGEKENEKLAPLHFAKSNAYKKVLEQEKEDKVKTEQKVEERKQLKDKAQQYAKLVKEMFFPKPDPKDDLLSKENLQEIIARSQKAELPVLTKESSNTTYTSGPKMHLRKKRPSHDITQNTAPQNVETQQSPERTYVPHNYLKKRVGVKVNVSPPVEHVLKEHKDAMILPSEGFDDEQTEVKPAPIKKKYEAKPRMVSMSPKRNEKKLLEKGEDEVKNEVVEPEFAKKAYPNYLTEVRNKRIEQEKKTGKGKYGQWEKFLKNKEMSQQEKVINILDDINRLEAQAKKKESKLKRFDPNREHEPLELEDEVGEMYLESIKAKLAIIKDLA